MIERLPDGHRRHPFLLVADVDGQTYRVRTSRLTQGAAQTATRRAALAKLEELRIARDDRALAQAAGAGDTVSTVGDLITVAMQSPGMAKRSPHTRQNYQYSAERIFHNSHDMRASRFESTSSMPGAYLRMGQIPGAQRQ